ncbi:MAG TPA: hypothetical protein VHP14_05830 [Anaerolineales bacterium]|nr:hypothetical protein [Anaerolineales bacterium]
MIAQLQRQRWLLLAGVLLIAGILAFPLRETIHQMIVVPVAFVAWRLDLVYRSFSQWIWWWAIIFIVFVMLVLSLMPRQNLRHGTQVKLKPPLGPVEALAVRLRKAEHGIYFKWLIANRLGKLAYQMLLHREGGRPRSVFAPLVGIDWEPSPELQSYLETGLHGSFAEFPNANRRQPTPLDFNIVEAVEFLESQVENGHLPPRREDSES